MDKEIIIMRILRTLLFASALAFLPALALAAPVDINTADATALAANLKGVGHSKAEAIVAYRKAHGSFGSAEDLLKVKGIGSKIVEQNRDSIRIN
jgi:competence protein ComEA